MSDSLISRAMRELAKRRHAAEDPKRLKEITSKAGRSSWKKLTQEQRKARIAKMVAARREKMALVKQTGQSGQSTDSKQRHRRKTKLK